MEQVCSKQMKKTLLQHAKQGFLAQLCSLVVRQEDIPEAWQTDLVLTQLIDDLLSDSTSHEGYSWSHGILTDKGRLVVKGPRPRYIGCRRVVVQYADHSATKINPYQMVYGQAPPHIHNIPGSSSIAVVDQWGYDKEATLRLLKEHLSPAQNRMKQMADEHRSEREFQIGDWVYLRLQPNKQSTVQYRANMKLSPRFNGPFHVLRKICYVAYHLDLSPSSRLHPVSHVSLLKRKLGTLTVRQPTLPPIGRDGIPEPQPVALLDRRLVNHKGKPATQVLIQRSNSFPEDATWEYYQDFQARFPPTLCLVLKAHFKGEGMLRTPRTIDGNSILGQGLAGATAGVGTRASSCSIWGKVVNSVG
ncbi:hypothetical protein RHSIM_Rhsim11G0085700 [Rhododendron simsii]|uniref:Tf2-1-like SH3-like domain-containing protein n=1 Tax=Rhododendron simsii TaxID=118357 RepID=A0A834G9P8_RHOSS|nr:hypothetical protein RHSIM_Rhsim11G0085700 [Rhododendron simsii]